MELALYDPNGGYYTRGPASLGPAGDYVTASDAGRAFGRALARQLGEIDRRIGPFDPFDVVELGSGRGLLARDVLDALALSLPDLAGRLRYVMVDRSPAMRVAAGNAVREAETREPDRLGGGRRGALLAVELFDALPVHRVRRRQGELVEVFVDLDSTGALVEVESAAPVGLKRWAERYGAAAEEGGEAEIALEATDVLEAMAQAFDRGVFILVDYGDRAGRLYSRSREGTLLAYHRHAAGQRYFERVGEQDLTAHVNFSALEERARELGLAVLGLTTQDRFLIANGVLDCFEGSSSPAGRSVARVKERLQALHLIHPAAMGRRFKVLLLAKGCDPPPALDGLRDPFA